MNQKILHKKISVNPDLYKWPEIDKLINEKVKKYLNNPKLGNNGLPDTIEKLENKFKKFHNQKYCLALSSGTAALHTAYFAVGISRGDEVIVSNYTFPATVIPLFIIGAKPILCDVEKKFANIDPLKIEKLITKKTKAIIITHWWGHPCNMKPILEIIRKYKLKLIEDCAHSPGAMCGNKLVGTFGDIGCFSLDNNKLLASGEGGLLITNNKSYFEKSIIFSDFGPRLTNSVSNIFYKNFIQTGVGTKYRIHFVAAKIAYEKLFKINKMNLSRKILFNYFCEKLRMTKLIEPPITSPDCKRGGFYGFKAIFKGQKILTLKKFLNILRKSGVDARITATPPLHMTNTFSKNKLKLLYNLNYNILNRFSFENSEWFHNNHISFPVFYKNSHKKIIDKYVQAILKIEKYFKV
jgi:dTDP-4-amino-4,6-dideoxygalactose transaminase